MGTSFNIIRKLKMARSLFLVALFTMMVAFSSAFVAPGHRAALAPRVVTESTVEPPQMLDAATVDAAMAASNFAANADVVASSVRDFGGYLFPIGGLGALSALILYLAPPLSEEYIC